MRKITTAVGFLLVLGWVGSAHAGNVGIVFDLAQSTGGTSTAGFVIPFSTVTGGIVITFTDPASSPARTVTAPIPHGSARAHGFTFTATQSVHFLSIWDLTGTLRAKLVSGFGTGTFSHGTNSQSRLAGSQTGRIQVSSTAHCSGGCQFAPGTWPGGASSTQTQTFSTSIHMPAQVYRHATNSDKYLESGTVTITPPGSHLVASNTGYHTLHVVGREVHRY